MDPEPLADRLARLERELADADRAYNDALTAVDRTLVSLPEIPHAPPAYDESLLPAVNAHWDMLDRRFPASFLKRKLAGFVWGLVEPTLERQRQFNAALVDHLNRNVAAHRDAAKASASTIAVLDQHVRALVRLQAHLMQYLQTITLFVDTRDRAVGGRIEVLNAALGAMTADWMKRWESLTAREQRFFSRLGELDDVRAVSALAQQTSLTLKREVEQLLARAPAGRAAPGPQGPAMPTNPPDLDAFKYLGFEEAFRGSADEIRSRLASYVPLFSGRADVLDIGCGRGEFLELLRAAGIRSRGLDLNHEMAEASRARGLDVVEADALAYLSALPDASLGGLFAAQVAEHLEPRYLMALLETAFHKIAPGGVMVLETINPACWVAFFESYIRDLTHVRPLHPETLQYLVRVSGFPRANVEYRSPVPAVDRLQPVALTRDAAPDVADFVETFNANVDKLNGRLYTHMDYAVVAHR